ncbi:ribosomal protein L21-like protein [Vararia minispora EC-137]|uniref:Ribosomal protein L21-like protein n=1 Tax=Vararia minispora EC-137 TaxID=1314806 RepID=A0ACB8QAP8_9AGAM|nr:ribosomal protein L21-like protein [Vararia minispora EC-137]
MASVLPAAWRIAARAAHTGTVPDSPASALSLIRSQPSQYVVASIVGRKYLIAPRDLVTVNRLTDAKVGDVLALNQIHEIGSRDYTLRGCPTIDPRHVSVNAIVVEHTKGKMEDIIKFKKRKGYKRTIHHKQTYTRLRIGPIEFPLESVPVHASASQPHQRSASPPALEPVPAAA